MPTKSPSKKRTRDGSGLPQLSRRERQIMDALYQLGEASAGEIHAAIPDPPGYTAVRTHLTLLEEKNHVKHTDDGTRYIYSPVVPREAMAQQAIEGVLRTFFDNSVDLVIAALMKRKESKLSPEQIRKLEALIEQARKEGR